MTNKYPTGIRPLPGGGWLVRAQKVDPRTGRLIWKKQKLPPIVDNRASTLADAVRARDALVRSVVTGGTVTARTENLRAFAHSWLERKLPRLQSKLTQRRYAEALDLHILQLAPAKHGLGDLFVSQIRKRDLEEWFVLATARDRNALRKRPFAKRPRAPYSPETINGWWSVLKEMVQAAVIEHGLPVDPTMGIRPLPKVPRLEEDNNSLSADELSRLLAYCRGHYPQWYAFLLLGFSIGARPGELRPIRWGLDLNPETGELNTQRSQRSDYMGPTKTKRSRKTIVTKEVLDVLLWHREFLFRTGHPGAKCGLVFPGAGARFTHRSGAAWEAGELHYLAASALDEVLPVMCEAIGVTRTITPRTMRRTFNDLGIEAQIDALIIKSITGHQSDEMRDRYVSVRREQRREASAKVLSLVQLDGIPTAARLERQERAKSRAKSRVILGPSAAPSVTQEVS